MDDQQPSLPELRTPGDTKPSRSSVRDDTNSTVIQLLDDREALDAWHASIEKIRRMESERAAEGDS